MDRSCPIGLNRTKTDPINETRNNTSQGEKFAECSLARRKGTSQSIYTAATPKNKKQQNQSTVQQTMQFRNTQG
jgi:hypothetical protein